MITDLILTYAGLVTGGLTLFVYAMFFLAPRRRRKPRRMRVERGVTCWCVAFSKAANGCYCVRFEDR